VSIGAGVRFFAGYSRRVSESLTTLITEDLIAERVEQLAAEIDADYRDAGELVLIGVLKGSFVFLSDLARKLTIPHRVEFISVSSYGDRESEDPGAVRLILDVRHDIGGRDVLIVEDIVDTGHTLAYLTRLLKARRPASLKTCTLLRKPDRAEVELGIDYLGFDIPDVWVVGYGLDFAERHRTLPSICAMKPPGSGNGE
jgi:hypoxanthine phosphoribosyltransferase